MIRPKKPTVSVTTELNRRRKIRRNSSSSSSSSDSDSGDAIIGDADISINVHRSRNAAGSNPVIRLDRVQDPAESPLKWSKRMSDYYGRVDEVKLNESMDEVMAKLPDNPDKWKIDRSDLLQLSGAGSRPRYFQQRRRCLNCNFSGHLAKHCPEPKKPIRCKMCGECGHGFAACPNQRCLRCGEPGAAYTQGCGKCKAKRDCGQCGCPGHDPENCPDNWRRFHYTIRPEDGVVRPEVNVDKDLKDIWCPNCAGKGHRVHHCPAYRYNSFPAPVLRVISYEHPGCDEVNDKKSKRQLRQDLRAARKARKAYKAKVTSSPPPQRSSPPSKRPKLDLFRDFCEDPNMSGREKWNNRRKQSRKRSKIIKKMCESNQQQQQQQHSEPAKVNSGKRRKKRSMPFKVNQTTSPTSNWDNVKKRRKNNWLSSIKAY